jgi:hypothetical protein
MNSIQYQCNKCGRQLKVENDLPKEDYVLIQKNWGYFSNKDTSVHTLLLCEHCYDLLAEQCVIPPLVTQAKELL